MKWRGAGEHPDGCGLGLAGAWHLRTSLASGQGASLGLRVDSRWVLRSLESHYWQLLAPGDAGEIPAATPLDYVEKIFQVPYQLRPLDAGTTRRMLRGLLQRSGIVQGEDAPALDFGIMPWGVRRTEDRPPARADDAQGGAGAPVAREAAAAPLRDMTPDSLHLEVKEHRAMDEVAALIGRTPRTVKRFANLYRILKVRALARGERLLDERSPRADYEILLLLAVSTGLPELAPLLFHALLSGRDATIGEVLESLVGDGDKDVEQRRRLQLWLQEPEGQRWAAIPAGRCQTWIDDVRRFSFIIDSASQTNSNKRADAAGPPPLPPSEQSAPEGDGSTGQQERMALD
jgi:hypothetical protein